jgi:hypothetical protein
MQQEHQELERDRRLDERGNTAREMWGRLFGKDGLRDLPYFSSAQFFRHNLKRHWLAREYGENKLDDRNNELEAEEYEKQDKDEAPSLEKVHNFVGCPARRQKREEHPRTIERRNRNQIENPKDDIYINDE